MRQKQLAGMLRALPLLLLALLVGAPSPPPPGIRLGVGDCALVEREPGAAAAPGLRLVALDVAPSTGVVYAAAMDPSHRRGELLAYQRGEPHLRPLPLQPLPPAALPEGFAPRELSPMEAGNAELLLLAANAAPRGGDTVEVLRVEDPLDPAGPTGLTLLQTVQLEGVVGHITGLWAVWPRDVYATACADTRCRIHHCACAAADWRAEARAASSQPWRRVQYSCSVMWPGAMEDGAPSMGLSGVVGSPMLTAVYAVRTGDATVGNTTTAPAELIGSVRLLRAAAPAATAATAAERVFLSVYVGSVEKGNNGMLPKPPPAVHGWWLTSAA